MDKIGREPPRRKPCFYWVMESEIRRGFRYGVLQSIRRGLEMLTGNYRPRLCQNVKIQILVGILDQLLPELHAEVVVIIMNLSYFEW